jgi:hypothetical protein
LSTGVEVKSRATAALVNGEHARVLDEAPPTDIEDGTDIESSFERRSTESMTHTCSRPASPSLLTTIQALELLIAEQILSGLELVAVAECVAYCTALPNFDTINVLSAIRPPEDADLHSEPSVAPC